MAMTAKEKRMADMKKRLAESSPSKLPKATKALKNKKEKSDKTKKYNAIEKKYIEKYSKSNSKGSVPTTTNSNKGAGNSNTDISKGSILTRVRKNVAGLNLNAMNVNSDSPVKKSKDIKKDKKVVVADKKDNKTTKSKTAASAGNTKNFASTMAMQKKLIKMYGAKIKADGIMGPKTRAAMAKYMKAPVPKSKPKGTLTSKFGGEKITAKQRLKEINDEKRKSYFSNLASSLKKKSKAKG